MKIHKIPNQKIKGKLQPLNLQRVKGIVIHHMAHPTADVKAVESWHINQGYSAIGYNYWVGFDGTIYEGRGLNQGAHTLGHNDTTIGIGFQGDYSKPFKMPVEQFNSGIDIITYVRAIAPAVHKIGGHRDFMATACPGEYFPLAEMISGVRREVEEMMIYNYIDENMPEWAREAVQWAADNGVVKGTGEGLGLTDQDLKYITWLYRAIEKRG